MSTGSPSGLGSADPFDRIVHVSPAMRELVELCRLVATDPTVHLLVGGETGTGKNRLVRAIHDASPIARGPFVPVITTAVPKTLLESELFGVVPGAATGTTARLGHFRTADRGGLFLDEVGDAPPTFQSKLLGVLQDGLVFPVGSSTPTRVTVRVYAATNRNLRAEVAAGRFRADLYYRLSVVELVVPPLRERRDDLPFLIDGVLDGFNRTREAAGRTGKTLSREARKLLLDHEWPGNVRELEHALQRLTLLTPGDVIHAGDVQRLILTSTEATSASAFDAEVPMHRAIRNLERRYVHDALTRTGGNKRAAAERLGISIPTLRKICSDDRP